MKKISLLLTLAALAVWAADFWDAKPYTDWSQKDIQKMMTNSPWSKQISVAVGPAIGRGGLGGPQSGVGGRGGRGGGGVNPATLGDASSSSGGGGAPPGGGGLRGDRTPDDSPVMVPAVRLLLRWQTALPVKQALVKAKYGAEAGTSPEAQKLLAREEQYYVLSVSGLPAYLLPKDEQAKQAMAAASTLNVKNKDAVAAADVEFQKDGGNVDAYFLFPRKSPFSLEDKEIEFVSKLGPVTLKHKFKLKDMVFKGKLEL
jgi:hypothetical protein